MKNNLKSKSFVQLTVYVSLLIFLFVNLQLFRRFFLLLSRYKFYYIVVYIEKQFCKHVRIDFVELTMFMITILLFLYPCWWSLSTTFTTCLFIIIMIIHDCYRPYNNYYLKFLSSCKAKWCWGKICKMRHLC